MSKISSQETSGKIVRKTFRLLNLAELNFLLDCAEFSVYFANRLLDRIGQKQMF